MKTVYTCFTASQPLSEMEREDYLAKIHGMNFIGYKRIEEFNRISYIECTRFEVAVYEDEYGIRHDYYCPENPKDIRRSKTNVVSGTRCTPEFLADLVVNRWMLAKHFALLFVLFQIEKCIFVGRNI